MMEQVNLLCFIEPLYHTKPWPYYEMPPLPVALGWLRADAFTLYVKADDAPYPCGVDARVWRDLVMLQESSDWLFNTPLHGLHRLQPNREPSTGGQTVGGRY